MPNRYAWKILSFSENINNLAWNVKKIEDGYEFLLTNLTSIWTETLKSNELLLRCRALNKLVESDSKDLIDKVLNLHLDPTCIAKILHQEERKINLQLGTKIDLILFSFEYNLIKADETKLHKELLFPLLMMSHNLFECNNSLIEIIKKKDLEIAEYKAEGLQITRKYLETAPYCDNTETPFWTFTSLTMKRSFENPLVMFTGAIQSIFRGVVEVLDNYRGGVEDVASKVFKEEKTLPTTSTATVKTEPQSSMSPSS